MHTNLLNSGRVPIPMTTAELRVIYYKSSDLQFLLAISTEWRSATKWSFHIQFSLWHKCDVSILSYGGPCGSSNTFNLTKSASWWARRPILTRRPVRQYLVYHEIASPWAKHLTITFYMGLLLMYIIQPNSLFNIVKSGHLCNSNGHSFACCLTSIVFSQIL